jgi:hypothetical protein
MCGSHSDGKNAFIRSMDPTYDEPNQTSYDDYDDDDAAADDYDEDDAAADDYDDDAAAAQ